MKLGVANRIVVSDVDLADTVDVTINYSDILYVLQYGDEYGLVVAQAWLEAV